MTHQLARGTPLTAAKPTVGEGAAEILPKMWANMLEHGPMYVWARCDRHARTQWLHFANMDEELAYSPWEKLTPLYQKKLTWRITLMISFFDHVGRLHKQASAPIKALRHGDSTVNEGGK